MHFYRAAGAADIKLLWDSVQGLFLHVQIQEALWNKTARLDSIILQLPNPRKIIFTATHRLSAIVGMNKVICFALIFRAVRHTFIALERKTFLSHCFSRIMNLFYALWGSRIVWGMLFLHFYLKCTSLIWLIHCSGNNSECQIILITANIYSASGSFKHFAWVYSLNPQQGDSTWKLQDEFFNSDN